MNTQKFIFSGIAGGIAAFFAGYLIYGLLLMDFFQKNTGSATGVMRSDADMVWWALILGNVFMGVLLSYIFNRWANINSFGNGAAAGAVILFLVAVGVDLTMYGTSNISNLNATIADIFAMGVIGAIVGGVVGLVNGLGKKTA